MLCKKPYMVGAIPFGCGQCLPCRVNKGRTWQWRQFLESLTHENNCFVTLTYDSAHIAGNWALNPRDLQLFIKRLRAAIYPVYVRFFAVGEYGDTSRRPHFHLSLFGVSGYQEINGKPVAKRDARGRVVSGWVHECWGNGYVDIQEFSHITAAYVAGYNVKKLMDRKNDFEWNHPEFGRMSNRPGLGVAAIDQLAKDLMRTYQGWHTGDVPNVFRCGNMRIPIGRYLLNHFRKKVGFTDEYIAQIKQDRTMERSIELQAMLDLNENDTFKNAYARDVEGRIRQTEARAKRKWLSRRGML